METSTQPQSVPEAGDAAPTAQTLEKDAALAGDQAPRPQPQLIKRAALDLEVEDVEAAIKSASQVVRTQQGDILLLEDSIPTTATQHHRASMELRVPQTRLDQTLEQLAALGTVQSQSVSAEDVSNQLVDFDARLRNLRKSEQVVLQIMDRSGSIGDVLKVSQELSQIRASIEQIEAQFKQLQTQVAYSTINLRIEADTAATPPQRALGIRLQESWSQSTRALGELTTGLLTLGVWVITFSPYWGGLLLLGLLSRRILCRSKQGVAGPPDRAAPPVEETPSPTER
jgi:ACT domain-containing protein